MELVPKLVPLIIQALNFVLDLMTDKFGYRVTLNLTFCDLIEKGYIITSVK